jgi:peptide/nickel transport system permease protein
MKLLLPFRKTLHARRAKWAVSCIALFLFLGLAASFLANDLPLYVRIHGESYFPALNPFQKMKNDAGSSSQKSRQVSQVDWKNSSGGFIIWPLIPYSPSTTDLQNTGFISPGGKQYLKKEDGETVNMPVRHRHWLGTTQTGNDVMSGVIHGARISLAIGFFSMVIAGFIGIVLGTVSGYAGDKGYRTSTGVVVMMIAGILPAYFYAFYLRSETLLLSFQAGIIHFFPDLVISLLLFLSILAAFYFMGRWMSRIKLFSSRIYFPLDLLLSRITEVVASLPRLVLILTLSALTRPSLINLVLIFGLTGWTDIARIVRAEMLKIRNSDYLQVAIGQGLPTRRIIWVHALPNIIQPALVTILFGVSGVILAESALSFLGIGVPFDTVTWGSLIASGKENFNAWWLVVFPGLAIFFTSWSLNVLADAMRRKI